MALFPESWGSLPLLLLIGGVLLVLVYHVSAKSFDKSVKGLIKDFSEDKIARNPFFRDCWKRYAKTFIKDAEGRSKTPEMAHRLFNQESIVSRRARLRFYTAFPTYIFGLGVIALFAGLVYGVLQFNMETHEDIIRSMKFFFLAVAASFLTFVFALVLSALFRLVNRSIFKGVSERIGELCDFLDERYNMSLLEERKIALKEHLEVLKEISQGSNGQEREWREAQTRLFQELLTGTAQQAEYLQTLSRDMSRNMERMSERLGAVSDPLGDLAVRFKALQDDLRDGLARMAESVNQTTRFGTETVQQSLREMSAGFIDSMEVFRKAVSGYADESKGHAAGVSQEIKESFERSARELGEMIVSVRETFYDALVSERETMDRSSRGAQHSLETAAAEMGLAVRDLRQSQEQTLRKLDEHADMVAETARDMRSSAQEGQALQAGLEAAAGELASSLDLLRQAAGDLADSGIGDRQGGREARFAESGVELASVAGGGKGRR